MEHIVDKIVSDALSIIIGLFLIDLVSCMLLDFSIVGWFRNLFKRNKKSKKE